VLRHDDNTRYTRRCRGPGYRLSVVPGGDRCDPARSSFARQRKKAVEGPPCLEGPGCLQVFVLEEDLDAHGVGKCRAPRDGRSNHVITDPSASLGEARTGEVFENHPVSLNECGSFARVT
jgi:hypothetical protein